MTSQFASVIGLEIHAELATASKLFCRCLNTSSDLATPPNTAICPVCLGLPGALPVINRRAIEAMVKLAQALQASLSPTTFWERKNYFYPDLPKGYQISQYDRPIGKGGVLNWLDGAGTEHQIALTRVHLEEDTAKLLHPEGEEGQVLYSLIDYNRSGLPLVELVTEPVLTSPEETRAFGEEYQRLLRELGVAEADMEKGQLRCEANVSVIPGGEAESEHRLEGTKVEIKNLNSFRSLERAIAYEISRQSDLLAKGERVIQETRGWDETKGITYPMRRKETSEDYRYFPEPDLYPLDLAPWATVRPGPGSVRHKLARDLLAKGVKAAFAHIVINDPPRRQFFEALVEEGLPDEDYPLAGQWLTQEPKLATFRVEEVCPALALLREGEVSPALFKEALVEASPGGLGPVLEKRRGEAGDNFAAVVSDVLASLPNEVGAYRGGKEKLFGFFVGRVRQALGGRGDPVAIAQAVREELRREK